MAFVYKKWIISIKNSLSKMKLILLIALVFALPVKIDPNTLPQKPIYGEDGNIITNDLGESLYYNGYGQKMWVPNPEDVPLEGGDAGEGSAHYDGMVLDDDVKN